jgi:hypothetical protein
VIAAAPPSPFLLQVAGGIACALVLFTVPGIVALRGRRLCFAPAVGVCLFGPLALLLTSVWSLSWAVVVLSWVLALAVAWWWGRRPGEDDVRGGKLVLLLAGLVAVIIVLDLFPWRADDRLYFMWEAYDHVKVAMVDGMVREGLPPRNPYYSPDGEAIPLVYYYGTHFLAASVCKLTGIAGWPGDVVVSWYAAFAFITLCAGWAIRWAGAAAGKWAVLACMLGSPEWPLRAALGPVGYLFQSPGGEAAGIATVSAQAVWAPQHVLAAAAAVLAMWALVRHVADELDGWRTAVVIGGGFAVCASSSAWIAVAVVFAAPGVLIATRGRGWRPVLGGAVAAGVLAAPVLVAVATQPREASIPFPIGLHLLDASRLAENIELLNVPLYWLEFLPRRLGVCYVVGLLALWAGRRSTDVRMALYVALSCLLMSQFFKSGIQDNDLGWRGLLPAILLLNARAAAWRCNAPHGPARPWWVVGVVFGLAAFLGQQQVAYRPWKHPDKLAVSRAFAQQPAAWEAVRRHTQPDDLVANNPTAYDSMIPFGGNNVNWALLADRPAALSNEIVARVTSFGRDPAPRDEALQLVLRLFHDSAAAEQAARDVRDKLKVKALMLDRLDPVWPGDAIEGSGAWKLVEESEHWKVYVAIAR